MKYLLITLTGFLCLMSQALYANNGQQDTVIIELDNDSRVVIYTKNKADLKSLEKYDFNKMIRNLNDKIKSGDVEYVELQDKDGDTYRKDSTVTYTDGKNNAKIRIRGLELAVDKDRIDDWDDFEDEWEDDELKEYTYVDKPVDRTDHFFNLELGTSNWLENGTDFPNESGANYAVRPWGSWYVGLNSVNRTLVGGPLFLDWGFGVTWYNWKFEDDSYFATKGEDEVLFLPSDPDLNAIKSKLTASYVNFTLVPMLDFGKGRRKVKSYEKGAVTFKSSKREGIRIGVGGYAGYRIASHSKFVYKDNGGRQRDKERNNFFLQNFRYGLRAQFGWKDIDLFANYDLNEVFAEGRGPDLNAISFGIIF